MQRIGKTTAEVTPELAQLPISSRSQSGSSVRASARYRGAERRRQQPDHPARHRTGSAAGLDARWQALILDKLTGAGSNLFYQPLDGAKPTQITHIDSEPLAIGMFSISPDGKQIAIGRSKVNDSDLVMFSNFR